MTLYYWEIPSPKVQVAHQNTYKGQRKEQLGTLNIQRKESDEEIGASWRRGVWSRLGKMKQNWLGRMEGSDDDPHQVLEVRKNETYAADLIRDFSLAACVNSLVQLPMLLLWGV